MHYAALVTEKHKSVTVGLGGSNGDRESIGCVACGCCILLLYLCLVLTLSSLCWYVVFFLPSTSTNTPFALIVVITRCNLRCAGGVFPWSTSTFTNVHTNEYAYIATCTVWWWWLWLYFWGAKGSPILFSV